MPEIAKVPEGYATLTPALAVPDAAKAIDLFKRAFDASVEEKMACEDGKIMHAVLAIGSSKLFLSDAMPGMPPTVSSFYVYLDDVDASIQKAKDAGMEEVYPTMDMFWGDRVGVVRDAFGNHWSLATHVREVSKEEMKEGGKKFSEMCGGMGKK